LSWQRSDQPFQCAVWPSSGRGWPTEALVRPESVSLHGREIPIRLSVAGCDEADPGGRRRASEIPVIVGSAVETIV
jgi:hypothetical protein